MLVGSNLDVCGGERVGGDDGSSRDSGGDEDNIEMVAVGMRKQSWR